MKVPAVSDSTCLIGLERVGKLDLLPALFDPIAIPLEVEREFGNSYYWLNIEKVKSSSLVSALKLAVDDGEAEAIALAVEMNCLLITDDKQARSTAKSLGVEVVGTVGVLIRAKRGGMISDIKPLLDDLETNGFYMSQALRNEAIRIVGE